MSDVAKMEKILVGEINVPFYNHLCSENLIIKAIHLRGWKAN